MDTCGFPLPAAVGTALQTGLVGLTATDRRARGTQTALESPAQSQNQITSHAL